MTDTQNTQQQTNQPVATPAVAPAQVVAPAQPAVPQPATPAQEDKSLQEAVDKVISNYKGFKDFMSCFSTKALYGIVAASALVLYLGSDCRGLRAPRDIYSNGAKQPSGIAVNKGGVQSVIYCETPELLNELKIIYQREGISLDKLLLKVDTERPYGQVSEKEVSKYLSK